MRKAAFLVLLLVPGMFVHGQNVPASVNLDSYGVRVEPDKRVMAVLATLEMARSLDPKDSGARLIKTPLSEMGNAYRAELDRDNAALPEDLRKKISVFVTSYKNRHSKLSDSDLLAPFISMAYALQPAPELGDPIVTSDLPGELLDVLDFAPLVREFYRRSTFSGKMSDYVKEYSADADATIRPSAREMVSELLDYLHTKPRLVYVERVKTTIKKPGSKDAVEGTTAKEHERRFVIVPEMLAPKGTINFLNIRDDYYVVVPPGTDLSVSEARRAFLRFVVDALVLERSKDIDPLREWGTSSLDEIRKANTAISPDLFIAVSRSLVAATDIRERQKIVERVALQRAQAAIARLKTDEEKKAYTQNTYGPYAASLTDEATLQMYEEYQKGAVFVFFFYDELKGVEDSGFDIASSLKEMMAGFDPAKEKDRIATTAASRSRAIAAREERKKHPQAADPVASNPVVTNLMQIQKTIEAKDYTKADADLKALIASYPNEPRIYYNMGRVAGLMAVDLTDTDKQTAKLREAQEAYSNVIRYATPDTDKALLSLTYVALGRIYEFANENEYALKLYNKAIEIGDVPSGGFKDALTAKQRLLKPQP